LIYFWYFENNFIYLNNVEHFHLRKLICFHIYLFKIFNQKYFAENASANINVILDSYANFLIDFCLCSLLQKFAKFYNVSTSFTKWIYSFYNYYIVVLGYFIKMYILHISKLFSIFYIHSNDIFTSFVEMKNKFNLIFGNNTNNMIRFRKIFWSIKWYC
jgi:hypothetical protein